MLKRKTPNKSVPVIVLCTSTMQQINYDFTASWTTDQTLNIEASAAQQDAH